MSHGRGYIIEGLKGSLWTGYWALWTKWVSSWPKFPHGSRFRVGAKSIWGWYGAGLGLASGRVEANISQVWGWHSVALRLV